MNSLSKARNMGGRGVEDDAWYVATKGASAAMEGGGLGAETNGGGGANASRGGLMGRLIRKAKKPPPSTSSLNEANFDKL